jgi:hypothetical protein
LIVFSQLLTSFVDATAIIGSSLIDYILLSGSVYFMIVELDGVMTDESSVVDIELFLEKFFLMKI